VIGKKQNIPIRIGESILENLKLTKVTSGSHHTLVLASNRVFGWGDPETGKTGRMLKSRNKNSQSLEIEAIGLKNVNDIFAGLDTSFAISTDKKNK
jgi:alpha-tubulin suppressor-like RCC1 family protein